MQFDVCTYRAYNMIVGFEWDEESKAGINFRKHGVRMPEAIPVFDDRAVEHWLRDRPIEPARSYQLAQ